MSQPKSITQASAVQPLVTAECNVYLESGELMRITIPSGLDAKKALDFATNLSAGVEQLLAKLSESSSYGNTAYCAELTALAFVAATVSGITRSVERSLAGGDQ